MPAKKKKQNLINLLPQEEFAASTLGRILTWLLSSFRVIVIFSEMVVMAAFLSRFWLDAKNTDLSEEIEQKSAIVQSYSDFEKNFRSAQKKLSIFSFATSRKPAKTVFEEVISIMPVNTRLTQVSISESLVEIKAKTASEKEIDQYLANLKNANNFQEVLLDQVSISEIDPGVDFTIKAVTKESKNGS